MIDRMQKMDTVQKKVKDYILKHHMIAAKDTVAAGISGGADSVCLLFVLQEIRREIPFRLFVVHINHGIRKEASSDAEYVEALCRQMELPFYLYEKDVKKAAEENGLSEEEAGRQIRYEAFREALKKEAPEALEAGTVKIAVAHNKNDLAETMLFQLFRGSGLKGLIGIRPVRDCIIRPLLCLERKEIEAFLQENSIKYCIDFTNEEDTYTRNRIRHHILPAAQEQVCSAAVEHMAQTADILTEAEEFLEAETKKAYMACAHAEEDGQIAVETAAFHKLPAYLQKQVLFTAVAESASTRKDIGAVHIKDILALFEREGNREICLPYGLRVRRSYGTVIFGKIPAEVKDRKAAYLLQDLSLENPFLEISVAGLGRLEFTVFKQSGENFQAPKENLCTKWFDYDKIKQSLEIRGRRTGDFLAVNDRMERQSIKKYMIQEKIPAQRRDAVWLLADGEHVLWVMGYRISAEYKVSSNTKHVLKVQLRGGQ